MPAAARALTTGGLTVAALPTQAGFSSLHSREYKTSDAGNTKRLTMNSSWTDASQCFIYYATEGYDNRIGPKMLKFSVTVRCIVSPSIWLRPQR
ncbi:hypothetical protein DFO58_1595 [Arthrobacter sp. AG1021]|nr:hypothetical protein DFO58_1595 [Arthrobacter sp. AG1021]